MPLKDMLLKDMLLKDMLLKDMPSVIEPPYRRHQGDENEVSS